MLFMAVEAWTRFSQLNFLKSTIGDEPILMPSESYNIARNYAMARQKLELIKIGATLFITAFWLFYGLIWLTEYIKLDTLLNQTLFIYVFIAINFFLTLPIDLYSQFGLDKKFGFSNMTPKLFISDFIKSSLVFSIIGLPVIFAGLWIIATLPNWWLYSFAFLFTLVVLANWLVPVFFFPLFNKFEPIDNTELETSIQELAKKSDFKLSGVFKIDASKRDKRLNAYFAGFGNSKRVALFDTLLEKLSKDEILAVLAHEFGHYKHKDLIKGLFISAITLFVLCFVFGNLTIIGLGNTPAIIICQFLLLGGALSFILSPLTSFISKANEYAADAYSKDMGYGKNLADALIKLVDENKSFPKASSVYKFFHYTHPSPLERIERLGR